MEDLGHQQSQPQAPSPPPETASGEPAAAATTFAAAATSAAAAGVPQVTATKEPPFEFQSAEQKAHDEEFKRPKCLDFFTHWRHCSCVYCSCQASLGTPLSPLPLSNQSQMRPTGTENAF